MDKLKTHSLNRLIELIKVNKKEVGQIYWLAIFSGLISLSLPFGIQLIINFIQGGTYSTSYFVLVFLITLGVILYSIFQIIELRILEKIQQRIFVYAGLEFAYRFPRIKIEELLNINARDLANRFFDSIVLEKSVIKLLTDFSISMVQIIISALVLVFYHEMFLVLDLLVLIIVYFGFKFTFERALEAGKSYSKEKYKTAYWIEEVAGASSTFKLAGKTELPMKRTDNYLELYLEKREQYYRWLNVQYIILNITKIVFVLGFLLIGGIMVMDQRMNVGQFVAAEVLVLTIINGVDKITNTLKSVYDTLIALEKIAEVTDLKLENGESSRLYFDASHEGINIEISNLNFKYPQSNKLALQNINLNIKEKEKVLITGQNNSGKTTLIKVISSLYEIKEGDIRYNNISIKNIDKERLRYDIGIYFQEDVIFNGTILENITLGRSEINMDYLNEMVDKIGLSKEFKDLPNGINSEIYAHGFGLPLSVVHKILFLRVIVTRPKLLLLENMHLNFLKEERENFIQIITDKDASWTLICIDKVDELAKNYDTIYIMEQGKIIRKTNYTEYKS
ncbi:MAG: ABC transporter ATP-binding protein [Bacteroidia bacterium]|nr:MAG: ABC transporter ATP-binding protein [Bacteroidia bacterium]